MRLVQWRVLGAIAVLSFLAGCMDAQLSSEVYFLREKQTDGPSMTALWEGELTLTKGCLHIQGAETSYAAIWPFEFGSNTQGDRVDILDGDRVVARVGDQIEVGGGEVPSMSQEAFERNYLGAFQCSGPYWLVAEVITASAPAP